MAGDFFEKADALLLSPDLPEGGRADLRLRVVADHFSMRQDHAPEDLARILSTLRHALDDATPGAVASLAHRLASHPQASRDLLTCLVERGDEAAAAALRSSAAFERQSLLRLAEFGPPSSATAIAERRDVPRDVATLLFRRPEREILVALAGNRKVHLDRATAAWLVLRARRDPALAGVLLARGPLACDLTPLFMFADRQSRAAMIVEARRREIGLVPEFRAPLPPGPAEEIRRAVLTRDRGALAGVFAQQLGLSRGDAVRFIDDTGGEPLALACNAAGVSPQQTIEILCWLRRRRPDDPVIVTLMRLATDLAPQIARGIIASIVGRPPRERASSGAKASAQPSARPAAEAALRLGAALRTGS